MRHPAACGMLMGTLAWLHTASPLASAGTQYLGVRLPFSITQLLWIEALLVGGAEVRPAPC